MEKPMSSVEISGVFAALLTPRNGEGSIDVPALRKLAQFLIKSGISSFAVNGATGEFCLTSPGQLRTVLSTVRAGGEGNARILCGVGGAGAAQSIELARVAESEEVEGLLLPMPYFYPYAQEDLDLFCRTVAGATRLPVLLYNLPQFTSGLQKETVRTLISEVPNIVGIKDSSGSLEILRHLTEQGVDACRIVGDDSVLSAALSAEVCDGVISGVACVVPELILGLYAREKHLESAEFSTYAQVLDQFVEQLSAFPTPWGLKWIAQARAILEPTFPLPLSPARAAQGKRLELWFQSWFSKQAL